MPLTMIDVHAPGAQEPPKIVNQIQHTLLLGHGLAVRAVGEHGLMFGPDVASSTHATLGGMIGNNSAGAHSILYGRTVEHVDGQTAYLYCERTWD